MFLLKINVVIFITCLHGGQLSCEYIIIYGLLLSEVRFNNGVVSKTKGLIYNLKNAHGFSLSACLHFCPSAQQFFEKKNCTTAYSLFKNITAKFVIRFRRHPSNLFYNEILSFLYELYAVALKIVF